MRTILPTLLSLAILPCAAAEREFWDVKLLAGTVPGIDTWKAQTGENNFDVFIHWKENGYTPSRRASFMVQGSYTHLYEGGLGYALDLGLFGRKHAGSKDFSGSRDDLEASAYGTELGLDVAWSPARDLLITAGPRFGLGISRLTDNDPAWGDGTGHYYSYAAQAGISYAIASRYVIGLDAGYMSFDSNAQDVDFTWGPVQGKADTSYQGNGAYINLVLGIRL